MHGACGAKTGTQIIDADDKKAIGIHRLSGANHVVPPTLALLLASIDARNMVRSIKRVAYKHGIRTRIIERAIGFVTQRVITERRAALQRQRRFKGHGQWCSNQHKKTRQR